MSAFGGKADIFEHGVLQGSADFAETPRCPLGLVVMVCSFAVYAAGTIRQLSELYEVFESMNHLWSRRAKETRQAQMSPLRDGL